MTHGRRSQQLDAVVRVDLPVGLFFRREIGMVMVSIIQLAQHFLPPPPPSRRQFTHVPRLFGGGG